MRRHLDELADADLALDEALALLGAEGAGERRELRQELWQLVEQYREDERLRDAVPYRGAARKKLCKVASVGAWWWRGVEGMPAPVRRLWLSDEEYRSAGEFMARLTGGATRARDKIRARGGPDRLLPPSRFQLGLALAELLAVRCGPAAVTTSSTGRLYDLMRCTLTAAGSQEPTRGLREIVRQVVPKWRNRLSETADCAPAPLACAS